MTLAMEQLVQQAAKHRYMSGGGGRSRCRSRCGRRAAPAGRRAHNVFSSSRRGSSTSPGSRWCSLDPVDARFLWSSIYDDNPVVFFEHRTLYNLKGEVPDEIDGIEIGEAGPPRGRRHGGRDRPPRPRGGDGPPTKRSPTGSRSRSLTRARSCPSTRRRSSAPCEKTTRCVVAHEAVVRMGFDAEIAAIVQRTAPSTTSTRRWSASVPSSRRCRSLRSWSSTSSACGGRARGRQAHSRQGRRCPARSRSRGSARAQVRDDRALAQGRGRPGREGRAALRARHREGDAGGRARPPGRSSRSSRARGRRSRSARRSRSSANPGRRSRSLRRSPRRSPPPRSSSRSRLLSRPTRCGARTAAA